MYIEIKIREVRQSKGISINQLSKLSGLSKGHISKIERQEIDASLFTIVRIAVALKVGITELYKVIN